jgi:hypothetical protein
VKSPGNPASFHSEPGCRPHTEFAGKKHKTEKPAKAWRENAALLKINDWDVLKGRKLRARDSRVVE